MILFLGGYLWSACLVLLYLARISAAVSFSYFLRLILIFRQLLHSIDFIITQHESIFHLFFLSVVVIVTLLLLIQ